MPEPTDRAQPTPGLPGEPGAGGPAIASFHLVRFPRRHAPAQVLRVLGQRRGLRATPGLRFGRVLGTARGRSMSLSADLTRWALFAVWDDDAALDRFLTESPLSADWHRRGLELWTV